MIHRKKTLNHSRLHLWYRALSELYELKQWNLCATQCSGQLYIYCVCIIYLRTCTVQAERDDPLQDFTRYCQLTDQLPALFSGSLWS